MKESQGELQWKRPSEYIFDNHLSKEIMSRFPLKNLIKFKNYIYEVYYQNECPLEKKKNKKKNNHDDFLNRLDNKIEYSSENKRMFKNLFKIFDKDDFYIVKHREKDDDFNNSYFDDDNKNKGKIYENDIGENKEDLDENEINKNITENKDSNQFRDSNNKFNPFYPRRINFEERACYFTKWIGSILQFIIEFHIFDEVNYFF
jgi:hypothetical protein